MTTPPAESGNLSLWTHSTELARSSRGQEVIKDLMAQVEKGIDPYAVMIPRSEAEAILAAINNRPGEGLSPERAMGAAKTLMGFFPAKVFNNPEVFAAGLSVLLASYHEDFVRRVCDPVDGLPVRLKFTLTLFDVKEALEAERRRRDLIRLAAQAVIAEYDRRAAARTEEQRWKMTEEQMEARRKQVDALMKARDMKQAAE